VNTQVIYTPQGRAGEYAKRAVNLYSGCSHGCLYCYAPKIVQVKKEIFHSRVRARPNILDRLKHDLEVLKGQDVPRVLLCFICDPYPFHIAPEEDVTREAIEILNASGVDVEVLTKGGQRAERDFDLLSARPGNAFATTLTFIHSADSIRWEPKAALPLARMQAIKNAHEAGIETWVSLEPVIDPMQSLELILQTHPFVDQYKVGTLNYYSIATPIDYRAFAEEAEKLFQIYKTDFLFKEDLIRTVKGVK
jgi:DNA repair photolyase